MKASWERGRPARTKPGTASAISLIWINRDRPHGYRLRKGLNSALPGNPFPLPDLWQSPLEPPPTPSWPFAVLRGPSWISFCPSCPFVDPLPGYPFPLASLFVALHGPLSSLFQPLGVPGYFAFPPARPLADPSRASSNPLVALRRSSWPFVDIFLSFVSLRGSPPFQSPFSLSVFLRGPSRTPFESFPTPWSPLRGNPPFPTFGGSLSSLLQPLSGPSPFFVALRGYLFPFPVDRSGSDWQDCARACAGGTPALPGGRHLTTSLFPSRGSDSGRGSCVRAHSGPSWLSIFP